jgi:hypothetical protein
MAACVLEGTAWLGIYYMSSPTVTLSFVNATINVSAITATIAGGATAWTVYDGAGTVVGSGSMASTATSITPVSAGSFVGGGAAKPGYYTVATNAGTNEVVAGNFCICPAGSNLYVPNAAGDQQLNWAAWLGLGPDRDNYIYLGSKNTASQIVANRQADEYFIGPQDSARPRQLWLSPDPEASYPTQNPTSAQWAALATALVDAGFTGAWYECPTNEPDEVWPIGAIVTYWNACATAILAVDSTAHIMGYDSGGIYNNSTIGSIATFLSGATSPVAGFTNHMENSHQNMSNIVMLREYIGSIKAEFATSGIPDLPLWFTETGINGGGYGVLQPRRDARQRTILEFVKESYGYPKESSYQFPYFDELGSGITTYLVNQNALDSFGNMRAGAYALHVMAEALFGTSCSPASPPAKLSFGPTGSMGDSLFAGTHYTSSNGDRVLLATNGIEAATVTLAVSATGTITYWDGWGNPATVVVADGRITVPVNDLLTYVFLPATTTVSVVDTDQGAVSMSSYPNMAANPGAAIVVNEAGAWSNGVVNNDSFAENNSGIATVGLPYVDATVPGSLTASTAGSPTHDFIGYALMGAGPPWQNVGCGLVEVTVTVGAATVDSYTCASAVSVAIPAATNGNSADPCSLTSWWTGNFARLVRFAPVVGASMKITINATGYGGQPDSAASYEEGDPQSIALAEAQVYELPFQGPFT